MLHHKAEMLSIANGQFMDLEDTQFNKLYEAYTTHT